MRLIVALFMVLLTAAPCLSGFSKGNEVASGNKVVYARVTDADVTTTGQSLVDVTGLSVALSANTVYEFFACLSVASSSSAGNKYGINFSAEARPLRAKKMVRLRLERSNLEELALSIQPELRLLRSLETVL